MIKNIVCSKRNFWVPEVIYYFPFFRIKSREQRNKEINWIFGLSELVFFSKYKLISWVWWSYVLLRRSDIFLFHLSGENIFQTIILVYRYIWYSFWPLKNQYLSNRHEVYKIHCLCWVLCKLKYFSGEFLIKKRGPCLSKKNCLPFSQNFPAGKAYRLLESILATKYGRHKLFVDRTREWFPVQNAFFVIQSHTILTINQRRRVFEFCLLFQNNTRGKFIRGNLQEFHQQISSHSETEQITRASSSSSIIMGRNAWSVMSYYITKRCCCLMCV